MQVGRGLLVKKANVRKRASTLKYLQDAKTQRLKDEYNGTLLRFKNKYKLFLYKRYKAMRLFLVKILKFGWMMFCDYRT